MRKHRRHRITIQFGPQEMEFLIPYSDAKKDLTFNRIVQDARNGKPGLVGECMDFKTCERLKHEFPHPAYYAEFTADRSWIVDKINKLKHPLHCVRYVRPRQDRKDIRAFDKPGAKKAIVAGRTDVVVERPIRLLAPKPRHKKNPWGGKPHEEKRDKSHRKPAVRVGEPEPRGALSRKLKAGLLGI